MDPSSKVTAFVFLEDLNPVRLAGDSASRRTTSMRASELRSEPLHGVLIHSRMIATDGDVVYDILSTKIARESECVNKEEVLCGLF